MEARFDPSTIHVRNCPITRLPDYSITRLLDSPPPYPPFVLLLEDIRRVQVERGRGSGVGAAEFSVAAVADGQVLQPTVDNQIDERGTGENAVRDQISSEPVEAGADQRADDHDGQPDFGIEILSTVEVCAVTDRTPIDAVIQPHRVADLQGDIVSAASARDRGRLLVAGDGQAGVARRASGENVQGVDLGEASSVKSHVPACPEP